MTHSAKRSFTDNL